MPQDFYELDVQTTHSAGEHTVEKMVERAERLGFTGVVITDYADSPDDLSPVKEAVNTLSTEIDVRVGAKIKADDPQKLNKNIRALREHVDVLAVHGGEIGINKAAVTDTRVDVLAHPELKRKDSGLDHVAIKNAAENKVAIELNIQQLLETRDKVRSHVLSHMRQNIRLAQKFDAPVVTSSGANTKHYLRAPRELVAFPRILGMDLEESFTTVSNTPRKILQRAERVQDENTMQPGVRKVEEGEQDGE